MTGYRLILFSIITDAGPLQCIYNVLLKRELHADDQRLCDSPKGYAVDNPLEMAEHILNRNRLYRN